MRHGPPSRDPAHCRADTPTMANHLFDLVRLYGTEPAKTFIETEDGTRVLKEHEALPMP